MSRMTGNGMRSSGVTRPMRSYQMTGRKNRSLNEQGISNIPGNSKNFHACIQQQECSERCNCLTYNTQIQIGVSENIFNKRDRRRADKIYYPENQRYQKLERRSGIVKMPTLMIPSAMVSPLIK